MGVCTMGSIHTAPRAQALHELARLFKLEERASAHDSIIDDGDEVDR